MFWNLQIVVILALAYECLATGYMSDTAGSRSARASGASKPRSSSYGSGEQSVSTVKPRLTEVSFNRVDSKVRFFFLFFLSFSFFYE